jgi:hypothetical protein
MKKGLNVEIKNGNTFVASLYYPNSGPPLKAINKTKKIVEYLESIKWVTKESDDLLPWMARFMEYNEDGIIAWRSVPSILQADSEYSFREKGVANNGILSSNKENEWYYQKQYQSSQQPTT